MGLHGGTGHQGLHPAQGLGEGEDPHRPQEGGDVHLRRQVEGDHAAASRVEDPGDGVAALQVLHDGPGVGLVPVHTYRQGLQAPQQQEGVKGPQRGAGGVETVLEALAQLGVGHRDHARHDVVVPAQVLGGRVHHGVGP